MDFEAMVKRIQAATEATDNKLAELKAEKAKIDKKYGKKQK